ncbi:MAG TPA: PHP domain-containing protein [Marmoricola sp.]|nr:PHP domain-containing protein [Marmoricola sp.]
MRIDLHTHSDRSDGTLSPREVVLAARAAGLDVVGLTDHDTAEGWDEARATAAEIGITVVPGMEISCAYAGRSVHLLAYFPDPGHEPLQEALRLVLEGRDQRTPRVCAKLRDLGIDIDEVEVARGAGDAVAIGRPHIADALIDLGVVADRGEAFDRFLSPGRPAYVRRYAAPLEEMLGIVQGAGGVPVIAHPWGRAEPSALRVEGLAQLQGLGLAGIEVDHQDHDAEQRAALRGIARELGLVVTGSSDFHGAGKVDHDLGCNTTDPAELERLVALADRVAARRTSPAAP